MNKDIKSLFEKVIAKHKKNKIFKSVVTTLSFVVIVITIYLLMSPAITLNEERKYTFRLIDSYVRTWKDSRFTTSYDLDLYFMDTDNNYIEGKNVTFEISATNANNLTDDPYGFGFVPYNDTALTTARGKDLIDALGLKSYTASTGEIYEFDHAEVLIGDTWHTFTGDGRRWHIWCQGSSAANDTTDPTKAPADYGWRGRYGTTETDYPINDNIKYKFVYKEVRYGQKDSVETLGAKAGITFKLFNYSGDNSNSGTNNINNNGVYNYFTFRGVPGTNNVAANINTTLDADGFNKDTHVKVKPTLDSGKFPVFDCQGTTGCTDFSLGYLFGATTNPLGNPVNGITRYNPTNTLLKKDDSGYYYYSSNSNAVDYDTQHDRFMLRNYVERGESLTTFENEANRYEFRPFNYWNKFKTQKTNTTYNRTYNYATSETDNWYGMTMEFNFYMPKDGKLNNQNMIFSFSGDDDVWVFIDGVLVLDLGGTHGAVDGTIDFATGEVRSYLNWNGVTGSADEKTANTTNIYQMYSNASKTNDVLWTTTEDGTGKRFADYSEHTIKFFYLERGASVSNCIIRFNMPVLPSGTLTVKKQFEGTDSYNEDHGFTLYDTTSGTAQPVANEKYTIAGVEHTTNANGYFTLKTNQEALFELINDHKYYVAETNPGAHAQSYSCNLGATVCPSINQTGEFTINPESAYIATFTNEIKKYDLNVNKIVDYDTTNNSTFEFSVLITDSNNLPVIVKDDTNEPAKYTVNKQTGLITFNLKNNTNIIIKDIPVDTNIKLTETKHDGYQVIIKSGEITLKDGDTHEFRMDSDKNITVHNIPGVVLPETGGTGIIWYLLIGISLIIISIKFGYKYTINMKQ